MMDIALVVAELATKSCRGRDRTVHEQRVVQHRYLSSSSWMMAWTRGPCAPAAAALVDRKSGSQHLRANIVRVQSGVSSPDLHIHAFDQYYFILEGEMRVVIGRQEMDAPEHFLVRLPALF
jgi:mannose-6-phosphate isomerase-like protein (cupin superfamily)